MRCKTLQKSTSYKEILAASLIPFLFLDWLEIMMICWGQQSSVTYPEEWGVRRILSPFLWHLTKPQAEDERPFFLFNYFIFIFLMYLRIVYRVWTAIFERRICIIDTMLKFNGSNSISKDALRDEGCPWLINCTTQEYLVNVGQDSLFNMPPHVWWTNQTRGP